MADDTQTADAPAVTDSAQTAYDLAHASMTHDEAVQFETTLASHVADGSLTENEVYQATHEAEAAHDSYEHAKEEQHEAAVAAESGDYAHAHDHSVNAAYDLQVVEDHGGDAAHPTIDALEAREDHTVQSLDHASWEQATAHEYALDASANADSGHLDHAADSADIAASHHDDAYASAHDAGYHHDDGSSYASSETAAAAETSGETAG